MDDFAQRLHEALVQNAGPTPDAELTALVRIARRTADLPLPTVSPEQLARMRRRFEERIREPEGGLGPLAAWLGLGPRPRPLLQRAALGAAAAAIAFSGGSLAAGTTPWDAAVRVGALAVDAARSLRPGGSSQSGEAAPTPSPTVTPSPETPTPASAAPTPTPDPTPKDNEEDEDDGGQRGRGSGISGGDRERTPEPGDDRRAD